MKNKQFLLDTNILIEFMCGTPSVVSKIVQTGFDQCCMSTISLHELYYGAYNAKKKSEKCFREEIARIEKLLTKLTVLPLDTIFSSAFSFFSGFSGKNTVMFSPIALTFLTYPLRFEDLSSIAVSSCG